MRSSYKRVFATDVFHTYFGNDICRCLRFEPSPETLVMGKRGFYMRNKVNGFDFYFNGSAPLAETFAYITHTTGTTCFEFLVSSTNPSFNLFTDIPVDRMGQLLFDSSAAQNTFDNGTVTLGPIPHDADAEKYVATIRIGFADILKYSADNTALTFAIRFNARATQWQYYIIQRGAAQHGELSIAGKPEVGFDGPQTVTIQSGQQALLFTSGSNLLPLSLAPNYKFDLVSSPQSSDTSVRKTSPKVVLKGLPNADPANIGIVRVDGKAQVSSPIYVYV